MIFGIVALVGLIASFHTILYAQGRQIYSLSRAGYFPSALSVTHAEVQDAACRDDHRRRWSASSSCWSSGTPTAAAVRARRSSVTTSSARVMLNMAVFGAMLSYIAQAVSFILLRRNQPNIERPYRSPLGIPGAVVTIVIAVVTLVLPAAGPELLPRA